MNDVKRIRRPQTLAALCALALLCGLSACGDDDSGVGKQDGGSSKHDGGGSDGSGDAGAKTDDCDEEDGGPGAGCDDGYVCVHGACETGYCGDGIKLAKEECDDGNVAGGDGCDPGCHIEKAGCGDGVVDGDEECDDGNRYDADACSNACVKNECRNARIDLGEECDDGNQIDDDECSNACTENRCRNARLDPGEECDDGNRINDDGCTNACKIVECGNAMMEGDEECDDGNQTDDDTCSNKCTANVCGNGRVDPGEVCDGLACSPTCDMVMDDECRPCEIDHCKNYQDYWDTVEGCFEGHPNSEIVPEPDPMFKQDCVDFVTCARANKCGFGDVALTYCYCGSREINACINDGPGDDAPCVEEWQRATRTSVNTEVLAVAGDASKPAGWATLVIQCDAEFCADKCVSP